MSLTATMMRVHEPGASLVADRIAVEEPGPRSVRVQVTASGMCHADIGTAAATGASTLPVTPGHEVAGVVSAIGSDVAGWQVGDRVAVGWFGGSCGHCAWCRRGDVTHCPERKIPGISYAGGWAESITVPVEALTRVPDGFDLYEAAPMGCAGVTTFNAVRHSGVPAGGRVAVFGLGGLGHLAVQYAAKMGYDVIAIARGATREELARNLGASQYIDNASGGAGALLREAGGADVIISTASTTEPVAELTQGLRARGRLVVLGADGGSIPVPSGQLVANAQSITGHITGSPLDIEEAMSFALLNGIRPIIERAPLEEANRELHRLQNGEPRFRIVLDASTDRAGNA